MSLTGSVANAAAPSQFSRCPAPTYGVATCAAELVGVIARQEGIDLGGVEAEVAGAVDRAHTLRSDVTVFSRAVLRFSFHGPTPEEAAALVKAFKGR